MGKSDSRGNRILCSAAERLGIDTAFGVPGTQNIDLFDALRNSPIRTVLATSDTSAAFMANGYYRACGKPALLATTAGPGFTHAITGLAEARHDSAGMLCVVTGYREAIDKQFRFQDVDVKLMAGPVVKTVIDVGSASAIAGAMADAYALAVRGEPGPVVLCIDRKTLSTRSKVVSEPAIAAASESTGIDGDVDEVAELIARSERIAIFAGQGAQESSVQVRRLAEHLRCQVVTTCSGRGVLPEKHPLLHNVDLVFGQVGRVNRLFGQCDLILALGCKFSHNGTAGFELSLPSEKLVHVDASEEVLGSGNYPARVSIRADVKAFLEQLWSRRECFGTLTGGFSETTLSAMRADIRTPKKRMVPYEPRIESRAGGDLYDFFTSLNELLRDSSCVVTDTGLHQTLTREYIRIHSPRSLVVPSDFQSTGYGLPAAVGAKFARPESDVIAIVGDGCLAASAMELSTALREGIDLTVIVFNDQSLGSVRLQQIAAFGHEFAVDLRNPDFRKLSDSLGISYFLLDREPRIVLQECLKAEGVKLLEVRLKDSPELNRLRRRSVVREKLSGTVLGDVIRKVSRRI